MEQNEASTCSLCRNESPKIFAFGECMHTICHVCSIKMRILCEETYCAICRRELAQVYFVSNVSHARFPIDPSKFKTIDGTGDCGIHYSKNEEWIRIESEKLLRNYCPICGYEFESFDILRDHVRRQHKLLYCDLCVEHLNLFPYERKVYNRQDLVQHIRSGDRDDKSFKGHPACKFCNDHFLDNDHLYRHMRQEHYYCHLCTSDNVYYSTYDLLLIHYRNDHFLCEIGQCKTVQFTNVFGTLFELRAHQSSQHSKSRAEARQLGALPLEFRLTDSSDRRRQQPSQQHSRSNIRENNNSSDSKTQNENSSSRRNQNDTEPNATAIATAIASVPSIDEFPTLLTQSTTAQSAANQRGAWLNDGARGNYSHEDFPALSSAHNSSNNLLQSRGTWRDSQTQLSGSTQSATNQTTVPSSKKKNTPSVLSVTNGISTMNVEEEFPELKSLGPARKITSLSSSSAWTTAKKQAKPAAAGYAAYRPQTRMNTNRIMNADEDDECFRRPMSSLMTSMASASSNITIISSSYFNTTQPNDKTNKNKSQSVPKPQDFPELPTTVMSSQVKKAADSNPGVWGPNTNNSTTNTASTTGASTKKDKKKKGNMSKKEFLDEVQSLPPSSHHNQSNNDQQVLSLKDLGKRLIKDETAASNKQTINETPMPNTSSITNTDQGERPVTASKNNKKIKNNVNDNKNTEKVPEQTQNPTASKVTEQQQQQQQQKASASVKHENKTTSEKSPVPTMSLSAHEQSTETASLPVQPPPSASSMVQAPPGFQTSLNAVSPPPGFNMTDTISTAETTYLYSPSYSRRKEEFQAKLFDLFDNDFDLLTEYDKFCQAYCESSIKTDDFLKFTTELFKDKLEEYLIEFITILPDIKKQIELYQIWSKEIQTQKVSAGKNWTKKDVDKKTIYQCHLCQQIMFDSDGEEHSSHHPQFNTDFPSLPAATIPLGRSKRKQNK